MKKVVKQDGKNKVYIMDDGSEVPFDKINEIKEDKPKKKSYFKKDDIEDDNE